MQRRCCCPPESASALRFSRSLTSSQSAAPLERALDPLVHRARQPEHLRGEGDVVVDRLRERVRLLEDHPDPAAHLDGIGLRPVEVLAVVEDLAADLDVRHEVVHPVQAADERALAAPGRADHCGDQVLVDVERHAVDCEVRAVGHAQVVDGEDDLALRDGRVLLFQARGDVDCGHVGGHIVSLANACRAPGLEDVNVRCRGGERRFGRPPGLQSSAPHGRACW